MITPTATGMRQTLGRRSLKIPISHNVHDLRPKLPLPHDFLAYEPSRTRGRASDMWEDQFIPTVADLIRTKKSVRMNKNMKKTVFRTGMEKLCIRFNQFTENVKVEFREVAGYHTTYYLDLIRLTPVPDSVRYAPSCAAEIPEPAALAQAVQHSESGTFGVGEVVDESSPVFQIQDIALATTIPVAPSAPLEDIPLAVATTIDTFGSSQPMSEGRGNYPSFSEVPEVELLRGEVDELRLQNALLRSQVEERSTARFSNVDATTSSEVLELRQEMEEMRRLMQQMMAAASSTAP